MSFAGLTGDISSLKKFSERLRSLPKVAAGRVAAAAAPALTAVARASFAVSETPYGLAWAPGSEGQRVTLKKSGDLEKKLYYVAIGTLLRVLLGVAHAKFQVGKRPVFPTQGAPLPPDYLAALKTSSDAELARHMEGA